LIKHGPSYPWRRYFAPEKILKMRPIHVDVSGDVTVCVLTSRYDWLSCLWSLVSFYEFSGLQLPLLIYSDGSLEEGHTKNFKRLFPNAKVVDPAMAGAAVAKKLEKFPNCMRFRSAQPCARRIIDLPILCSSPFILMLDSDIFFLRKPEELIEHLSSIRSGRFVFERDMQDAYFASLDELRECFGVEVSALVNCGIMLADVSHFKYDLLEHWLERDDFDRHPWAEQTLWAMYAGQERTAFLGNEYDVTMAAKIETNTVMKHYIKPIRDFLYTDGIPRLRERLEERGVHELTASWAN
jgi:hypothetical protein